MLPGLFLTSIRSCYGVLSHVVDIIILSALAGFATGLGGLIVAFKRPGKRAMGFLMGLAAGIMIVLAFLQLLSEAVRLSGLFWAAVSFIAGALVMSSLDFALPHKHFSVDEKGVIDGRLLKSGVLIAIGISLHNIPEGIAVASSFQYLPRLGLVIAVAMALHNIPEGIAIALPIYSSGASRLKAFKYALVSGLMEPLGALVAAFFLEGFPDFVPFGLAFAGGVMVFITLDELIPVGRECGHENFTSLGIIAGCIATFVLLGALA